MKKKEEIINLFLMMSYARVAWLKCLMKEKIGNSKTFLLFFSFAFTCAVFYKGLVIKPGHAIQ